jgi:hypothetical protein
MKDDPCFSIEHLSRHYRQHVVNTLLEYLHVFKILVVFSEPKNCVSDLRGKELCTSPVSVASDTPTLVGLATS